MSNKFCYYTTYGVKVAQKKYAKKLGLNNSAFVNFAINRFLNSGQVMNQQFLITKKQDPNYVSRSEMDQIILNPETKERLKEVAEKYNCTVAVVVFQAVFDLCFELIYKDDNVKL